MRFSQLFKLARKPEFETEHDLTLDLRGLECPTPVMKAKKALEEMEAGKVLKVVATDGMTAKNFATYAVRTGNELVEHWEVRGEHHYVIKRGTG